MEDVGCQISLVGEFGVGRSLGVGGGVSSLKVENQTVTADSNSCSAWCAHEGHLLSWK